MPLQPRDRLGPYEIQTLLGVGGMGEVYRGRDTRLGRDVALKVISPARLGDPELRRRFQLEARAASALNHPSIVTIYDVGETEGVSWIAMEWVEGRTLREALVDGPLPLNNALSVARQIAEGLATAHAKGIVHRDLKPENVMLTVEGRTKILDFGLARQTIADSLEGSGSHIDTLAALPNEPTFEGSILGTVGYMSPEQASGRPVGFHSDQFSFGLIVYEMLAGQRAFSRPTAVQTLSAIITDEPAPLASVRSDAPAALQNLIARCLAKRPDDRFASTREIVVALEYIGTGVSTPALATGPAISVAPVQVGPSSAVPVAAKRRPLRRAAVPIAAAVALALAAVGYVRFGAAKRPIESLAVLPFARVGGEADAEYLGNGLTENLIDQLSRVPALKVMARATVFRFKDAADPQEAGRKLGVGAVLTGSVSRRGDDLSISAELIETSTGARLWGESYDRPLAHLLNVQDAIASAVSEGLRLRLSDEEKRALALHGTTDPEAYELALKARYFFQKETEEGNLEARRLYERAAERDPKFAEAWLGIGATHASTAVNGYGPPAEAWSQQAEALGKARNLEPGNVLVRAALAHRRFYFDWDWNYCEGEYRALATDPRVLRSEMFRPIGLYLWARGRADEAVALMERALRIDPGNVATRSMNADFLVHAGRLDEAVAEYGAIVAGEPSNPIPLYGLAELLRRRGDVPGAVATLRKAYELSGEETGAKALAPAKTEEDYEEAELAVARARLGGVEELASDRYVSPLDLARLQAQAGEREKAFASLQAALVERSPGLVFLKVDRAWDRIRDDPRFAAFVRRVRIP
jgi:TolB-like protein/tetratricopeptide (TPR) repeat protein/predicted Ser/Thr protein kinase